jgi:uncharacterized membrane protein YfcA
VLALATGLAVFIGIALGLLGGGGSILTVPLLVYVVGLDTKQAIASGLFVVGVTSLVGTVSHARAGRVRWRTGLVFGAAGMAGAFVGARIGAHLPGALLLIAFALMMVATAIAMIRGRRPAGAVDRTHLPMFRTITDGALVGLVTGTVGAGGGFLVVPALALLGGLPMPIAIGTSLLVISMNTMAGFLGYATTMSIDWTITLLVTAGAVVGALVGSRLAGRVSPEVLRRGFGWFVLAMASVMLVEETGAAVLEFGRTDALHSLAAIVAVAAAIALVLYLVLRPSRHTAATPGQPTIDTPDDLPAQAGSGPTANPPRESP